VSSQGKIGRGAGGYHKGGSKSVLNKEQDCLQEFVLIIDVTILVF